MALVVGHPEVRDAARLGEVQLEAWLQTYPNDEAGIDEAWIREHRGSAASAEGIARWTKYLTEVRQQPDTLFCRVVRSDTDIVGFLCGRRGEVVGLGPMYLLDEAQGAGAGGRLMREFLAWSGDVPTHLWVTEYNVRAVRFYERHGFRATGERELWRGRLPNVRMLRAGAAAG
ncbi:GNAT family N-acetyltransferase [Streptomyces sp. NPDC055992]|uniref:GNAT family N-acetyltransferase n=1 Tax=Streptomyces sp. NPDC055992 TaxID=3345673 RepID=UPI0035DE3731